MAKVAAATVINTVTDQGVEFGIGNTLLNAPSAGTPGILFNLASVAICGALRARAEHGHQLTVTEGKPSPNFYQRALNHRGTSLFFAGGLQLGVAIAAAVATGLTAGAAIPFAIGIGNLLAAPGMENRAAMDPMRRRLSGKIGYLASTILTTPESWWATGLLLAAGSVGPGLIFAAAAALVTVQSIRKANPQFLRHMPSMLNNPNAPLFMLGGGNALVVLENAISNPYLAAIAGFFALGYVSIYSGANYGGVAQAVRTLFKPKSRAPESTPG